MMLAAYFGIRLFDGGIRPFDLFVRQIRSSVRRVCAHPPAYVRVHMRVYVGMRKFVLVLRVILEVFVAAAQIA